MNVGELIGNTLESDTQSSEKCSGGASSTIGQHAGEPSGRRRLRRARGALLIALVSVLAACGKEAGNGAGAAEPTSSRLKDVLLITVDTLRADSLGCYGSTRVKSPHIDELAAGGARFASAFSPRGVTLPSLTTILTGIAPLSHGVLGQAMALPADLPTLGMLLKGKGYHTGAFITNQCSMIVSRDDHIGKGFDVRWCGLDMARPQYEWDASATRQALKFLAEAPADKPVFVWLHLMDPHGEYEPLPEFAPDDVPAEFIANQTKLLYAHEMGDTTPPASQLHNLWRLYEAEIAGTDCNVGRIVGSYRELRPADSVIVFTSDHGEELFEHNNFLGHGDSIHDSVLHVPLIIEAAGLVEPGLVTDVIVELQDVAPTILDLLGLPVPSTIQGRSLAPLIAPDRAPPGAAERQRVAFGTRGRDVLTIRSERYRYVFNRKYPTLQSELIDAFAYRARFDFFQNSEMLFDLHADPGAHVNLLAQPPEPGSHTAIVRKGLRDELLRWAATHRPASQSSSIVDPAVIEELRQLGYLEFIPEDHRDD